MVKRVLVAVGTRPEAVKLAPVVRAAAHAEDLALDVAWTGQHAGLLVPHAPGLGVAAPMGPPQGASPHALRARVRGLIEERRPDAVLGQGDTGSVLAAAEESRIAGVPFVHLEAGLRSGSLEHPWPEESNRIRVARLATLHLAPTGRAAANLVAEGVDPATVVVTGNTIVDAVHHAVDSMGEGAPTERMRCFDAPRTRVLFTHHRRESFGAGAASVARAVASLARRHRDVEVVMPSHPNPGLEQAMVCLSGRSGVRKLPPLEHRELLWLLRRCRFAITDSGGLQEEAPSLGVPLLVTRQATERPEAVELGWALLVGWDRSNIERAAERWLTDDAALARARPRCNPYGDGRAAARCLQAMRCLLGLSSRPAAAWTGPARAA